MNLFPLRVAVRYLLSKKSTNAINIITYITMVGMGAISFALVLILSVFNGFEDLNIQLNNTFNPDLTISPKEGKVFVPTEKQLAEVKKLEGVASVSEVLLEQAALKYADNEFIGTLKGVDENYKVVTAIDTAMVRGNFVLDKGSAPYAVFGAGVERNLDLNIEDHLASVTLLIPNRGRSVNPLNPSQSFTRASVVPAGTFSIQMEYDYKYVFVDLDFLRSLLKYEKEVSALEIKVQENGNLESVRAGLGKIFGKDFHYRDRYQQNETLYKVIKTEKLVLFAILSFVLAIAGFNIIGSLSMLVLEKTRDIAILKAMGADNSIIRRIFLFEGLLSSLAGSLTGIVLAIIVCLLQMNFGIIKLQGSGSFIIDAYPVKLKLADGLSVLVVVVAISLIASWVPAYRASLQNRSIKEE
ncbi:MAG: FtsX-like permease family protein [Chitinophagales bacterium]|nr:FtsX-like permease family protein [Chitinophagales bacterium]